MGNLALEKEKCSCSTDVRRRGGKDGCRHDMCGCPEGIPSSGLCFLREAGGEVLLEAGLEDSSEGRSEIPTGQKGKRVHE